MDPKKYADQVIFDLYYKQYKDYFNKSETIKINLHPSVKKSSKLTYLRKIGDLHNQYVTSVRYLDTIYYNYDSDRIYKDTQYYDYEWERDVDDIDCVVYDYYHKSCDHCDEHFSNVKNNLIVSILIHPKGKIPKSYSKRKENWQKFTSV
jgi:hypothetical protein